MIHRTIVVVTTIYEANNFKFWMLDNASIPVMIALDYFMNSTHSHSHNQSLDERPGSKKI